MSNDLFCCTCFYFSISIFQDQLPAIINLMYALHKGQTDRQTDRQNLIIYLIMELTFHQFSEFKVVRKSTSTKEHS